MSSSTTSTTSPVVERCDNALDDDGDDLVDCQDPDCTATPTCPSTCASGPTFTSIECRLDALVVRITTTSDIQAERARLVVRLTAGHSAETAARTACAAGDAKRARKALAKAARRLQQYLRRLRTRAAKQTLDPQLRVDLDDAGDALRSDVKTLRATVTCPDDAVAP